MIARKTRHAFRVDSDTARILNGYTLASMEAMIAELGKRTTQRTLPPPGLVATAGSMPDELLSRYGLMWLAEPDPLEPRVHRSEGRTFIDATPELPAVPGSIPFVHNADTAPAYWWLEILWIILVKGEDTGGRYSLM